MVKKSLIWLYTSFTWLLWGAVIVLAAVVLSLRYFILPNIQQYRETIARHVSEAARQQISIGDIRASWDGMQPHLDLYTVEILDAQNRPVLTLKHVETSLSWLSLPLAEPRLSHLVIHQPKLTVRREADGTIYVAGISMSGPSRPELPNWLLRQSSIDVIDASVTWEDELRQAPPLSLDKLTLHLSNPAWESFVGRHRFGLRATPSAGASHPIDIRGNVLGKDVSRPEQWRGTLYAKVEGTDIAAWRTWIPYPFDLKKGYGATQFWLDFSRGQADELVSDVVLSDVVTRLGEQLPETSLDKLSARFYWKRMTDGQEIRAERVKLVSDGLHLQNGKMRLRNRLVDNKERTEGSIFLDSVNLEQLEAFTGHFPIEQDIRDTLQQIAPKGQLSQFEFDWNGTPTSLESYDLKSRFSKLAMAPYKSFPGFTGLSGDIEASQDGGKLSLDSSKVQMEFRDVLRWPIPADKLTAQASWKRQGGKLEVKVPLLSVQSPHLSGTIKASYQHGGEGRGTLDLEGNLDRADGIFAHFYYPTMLSANTLHWLDTSILHGQGKDVKVIVKGNLDQFPWKDGKGGLFQVSAKVSEGVLDYAEGWPEIDNINLDLLFRGNRMELNASQGFLYGNRINKAKIVIPALDAANPELEITGTLQSPAAELIKYVNNSPILNAIDGFTKDMQASGSGQLSLGLRIPLSTAGEGFRVKGSYLLKNGSLKVGAEVPPLEQVNGRLDFTESTIKAENVKAQVYGNPIQFTLRNDPSGAVDINAAGSIDDAAIRQLTSNPLAGNIHGRTDWTGKIKLRDGRTEMLFKSSLTGISLSLPAPFAKSWDDQLPLQFEQTLMDDSRDQISFNLGNVVSAKLLRAPRNGRIQVERGEIALGAEATLPEQPGTVVKGHLDYLDWEQWQSLSDGKSDGGDFAVDRADLSIRALDIFGRRINDVRLQARQISDGWVSALQSREINGDITWMREGNGKVVARLKSLTTPQAAPAKLSASDAPQARDSSYPELDIVAESFEHKAKQLGRLELLATQQGSDWNIDKLNLSNPESTLSVSGKWSNWRRRPNTRLNIHWQISDLGGTVTRYGYPDTIKGGNATLNGQLSWPGGPHNFDPAQLNGKLALDAKHGQFLKVKPGVGRLFSVLSLQNLPRRLLLDFSDVFSSGFGFDRISGNVRIDQGIMKSDDFEMIGPTALVQISGETDLQHETQKLHIRVIPSISDSLSLAALAGGPAVGIAAFVAQKLLKDPINKLASYEYDIAGTWDDPQEVSAPKKKESGTPTLPGAAN